MGLSGRKLKQRIPSDPRNLSWADDAARFGSNYLSKFGWDASKGLGANGEGRSSHIKVAQKLDMLGIGAAHQRDPDGIAWKQNKDFENLLKRLNEANGATEDENKECIVDGFVKPTEEDTREEKAKVENRDTKKEEKKDKKKEEKKDKKKRKRDGEHVDVDRKIKKKRTRDVESEDANAEKPSSTVDAVPENPAKRQIPHHRSHRARLIAAKSLASKSATAISEILGIAPTPTPTSSTLTSGTQTPQEGKLTSIYDDDDTHAIEKITTSTKSLQDYFKEKMGKLKGVTANTTLQPEMSGSGSDYDDLPRRGLGSSLGKSKDTDIAEKSGISIFSSSTSLSFMAAASLSSPLLDEATVEPSEDARRRPEVENVEKKEESKKVKKKEKKNESKNNGKEERKRRKKQIE